MVPNNKDLWNNYGITVDNVYDSANQYINDIIERDMKAHYKILARWGLSLSQRLLLMYTETCRIIIDMLPEHPDQPTLAQLLSKMGKRLFDRCVKYTNSEDNLVSVWNCKLADLLVEMDLTRS